MIARSKRPILGCVLLLLCSSGMASAACEVEGDGTIDGSPLSFWLEELRAPERERRRVAEKTLRDHAAATLSVVVVQKSKQEGRNHRNLHENLRDTFNGAAEAVPALLRFLECDNERAREAAVQVLGWLGPGAHEAVPALIGALEDPDSGVRMQTAFTLKRIGDTDAKTLSALAANLEDEDWYPANAAAMALAAAWPRSKATLRAALTGENATARYYAMHGLRHIRDLDAEFIPRLVRLAEADTAWNRNEALQVLYGLDVDRVAPFFERLLPLLGDEAVRCEAGRLLAGRVAPETDAALIGMLIDLMQGPASRRRDQCHEQVHKDLPRFGERAVEPLVGLLDHPDPHVRRNALVALMSIYPRPASVFPHVLRAMEDPELRSIAGGSLVESGPAALPVLREALTHDDPAVRAESARTAARMGEEARPLVPLLIERLSVETGVAREPVIVALGRIGGNAARGAVPTLRALLEDPELHAEATSAVARLAGADAADLAPELVAALAEQSQGECPHPTADDDLRLIGPAATPALVDALRDPEYGPKLTLLGILAEWGEPALRPAVPILREWVDREDRVPLDVVDRLMELGALESARAERLYGEALESVNDWIRLRGAEGLARLGGEACRRGRAAAAEMLDDRHENLRERARAVHDAACAEEADRLCARAARIEQSQSGFGR